MTETAPATPSPEVTAPEVPVPATPTRSKWLAISAIAITCLLVLFTYRSPELSQGNWQINGLDYDQLHRYRIEYFQTEFAQHHSIPAWFSREFLGSPFWSNLQNFPLIPTRVLLLWMNSRNIFTVEAYLLALLSVVFAFLYARTIGLGIVASAVAGFTFACSGFYVSRMAAGQIGILEVYPSLPAMLWVIHRLCVRRDSVDAPSRRSKKFSPRLRWYVALALMCFFFALAAHPQIFIYSAAAAGAYLLWRCRNPATLLRAVATMALALGTASFMLYPMSRLVARSSRMLDLGPAANDLPYRFDRLPSMFFPWINGTAPGLHAPEGIGNIPREWKNFAYFWDAVDYVGKLPVIAAALLIGFAIARTFSASTANDSRQVFRPPSPDARFITMMAVVALLLALPILSAVLGNNDGASGGVILLRSPARLMYLVTLALALGLGAGLDALLRFGASRRGTVGAIALVAVGAIAGLHFADLYSHDRCFLIAEPSPAVGDAKAIAETIRDRRVAIDRNMIIDVNRRFDDIGVFDSILLKGTYESMLDINGRPEKTNIQEMDGGQMTSQALCACAVPLVITHYERQGERPVQEVGPLKFYLMKNASPRVAFFPATAAHYVSPLNTRALLRNPNIDIASNLVVPPEARASIDSIADTGAPASPASAQPYDRPSDSRFEVHLDHPTAGFVRLIEGWDDGWEASIDGNSVPIFRAHNMAMAIPVPPGKHDLVVEFFTPGRNIGIALSLLSLGLLAVVLWTAKRASAANADRPLAA